MLLSYATATIGVAVCTFRNSVRAAILGLALCAMEPKRRKVIDSEAAPVDAFPGQGQALSLLQNPAEADCTINSRAITNAWLNPDQIMARKIVQIAPMNRRADKGLRRLWCKPFLSCRSGP